MQGLAVCGHCGRRLAVHYSGRFSAPGYHCAGKNIVNGRGEYCLNIGGVQIDAAVAEAFLAALAPAGLVARLEQAGRIAGVITQNIDRLHQAAGSHRVLEIHGDASRLRCLRCGRVAPLAPEHLEDGPVPLCRACDAPLRSDVVLFEEAIRGGGEIASLLDRCDLLLLVGTSADVWPASSIPARALERGVDLVEFNVGETRLSEAIRRRGGMLVRGRVTETLPRVAAAALHVGSGA